MLTRILASAVLVAGLSQAANAQNSSNQNQSTTNNNGQQSSAQPAQNVPQDLQKKLTDAGFTNLKIVPSSFFVTAKNKQGQDVMMRITPDSMTMVTEVPVDNASTTGSGSNSPGTKGQPSNGGSLGDNDHRDTSGSSGGPSPANNNSGSGTAR